MNEIPVQNHVAQFYESLRYKKPYSLVYHQWWIKKMLSMISLGDRILDVGCGTGIMIEELLSRHCRVIGLDISSNMLARARKHCVPLVQADCQKLPFKDCSVDTVIARSLLHHVPDSQKAVSEICRVLRKNGDVVFVETNQSLLSSLPRRIAKKGGHFSDDHKNMRARELTAMLQQSLTIKTSCFFGYAAYPIGFPDIIDLGKYIPCASALTKILIFLDEIISRIPFVRTQSWGIMVACTKTE